MLIVVQKTDEPMTIGDAVIIIRVDGPDRVRVCIDAPRSILVERTGVLDRKLNMHGFVRHGDIVLKQGDTSKTLSVREALELCES